jgi:Bacterial Ig-like domain (group 3)
LKISSLSRFLGVCLLAIASLPLAAQTDFGTVNVGASSTQLVSVNIPIAGTLQQIVVSTGGTAGLDFSNAGGGSCSVGVDYAANTSCTVQVTYTPQHAGPRYGGALLMMYDFSSSTTSNGVGFVKGVGVGPQVAFPFAAPLNGSAFTPTQAVVDENNNVFIASPGLNGPLTGPGSVQPGELDYFSVVNNKIVGLALGFPYTFDNSSIYQVQVDGAGIITTLGPPGGGTEVPFGNGGYEDFNGDLSGELNYPNVLNDWQGNNYSIVNGELQRLVLQSDNSYIKTLYPTGLSNPVLLTVGWNGVPVVLDDQSDATPPLIYPTIDVWNFSSAQAPALSFATTAAGAVSTDSPQTVTVSNAGNSVLHFSQISFPADFSEGPGGPDACTPSTSLKQGQTCEISIDFSPHSNGPLTESVIITDNNLNHTSSQQIISVTGTGVGNSAPDANIQVSLSPASFAYPASTVATVKIKAAKLPTAPTGSVQLFLDGAPLAGTLTLSGAGQGFAAAYSTLKGIIPGSHQLTASYSGDAKNPSGTSAPVALHVSPQPTTLQVSCQSAALLQGKDYRCSVYTQPIQAGNGTLMTYSYDGVSAGTRTLSNGAASFAISAPTVGTHTVVISYAAQGNFAAAAPVTETFKVTAK